MERLAAIYERRLAAPGFGGLRLPCYDSPNTATPTAPAALTHGQSSTRSIHHAHPGHHRTGQSRPALRWRHKQGWPSLHRNLIDGRGHRHPVDPTAFTADFHDAVFHDSSITGYRLDHTALPHQDDLAVVRNYPTMLRTAADWLRRPGATDVETRTSGIFDYLLRGPGGDDTDYCFDLNGYGNSDTTEAVAQALTQAQGSIRA